MIKVEGKLEEYLNHFREPNKLHKKMKVTVMPIIGEHRTVPKSLKDLKISGGIKAIKITTLLYYVRLF